MPKVSAKFNKNKHAKVKLTPRVLVDKFRILIALSLGVLLLLTVVWGVYTIFDEGDFPISTIRIEGNLQHINKAQLQQLANPYFGQNFFLVNIKGLQTQLLQLPWIANAMIQRQWPHSLIIDIAEKQPVARWGDKSLLSAKGDVFTPKILERSYQNLPKLNGEASKEPEVWQAYQRLITALAPLGLHVSKVSLSLSGMWQVQLKEGTTLLLGQTSDIWVHLQRYIEVYPKLFAHAVKPPATVDLRYPDGLAVKW